MMSLTAASEGEMLKVADLGIVDVISRRGSRINI